MVVMVVVVLGEPNWNTLCHIVDVKATERRNNSKGNEMRISLNGREHCTNGCAPKFWLCQFCIATIHSHSTLYCSFYGLLIQTFSHFWHSFSCYSKAYPKTLQEVINRRDTGLYTISVVRRNQHHHHRFRRRRRRRLRCRRRCCCKLSLFLSISYALKNIYIFILSYTSFHFLSFV